MVTMVDPKPYAPGDDSESVHPARASVQTPGINQKIFTMEMEEELYDENKKFHIVLQKKIDNCLQAQHPELFCTMEK
jgi:hypothetical protein